MGFDDHWTHYLKQVGLNVDNHRTDAMNLHVDTSVLACEWIESGKGCAVLIERFARRLIETGRSIKIIGDPVPLNQSHYFVQKVNEHEGPVSAEIESFKDWIRSEFQDRR